MQSVIDTLDGAVPSMLSRSSMRWKPPETIRPPEPPSVQLDVQAVFADGLMDSLRQLGEELTRFFAIVEPKRDPRVSAMRRAYRAKRGRGW